MSEALAFYNTKEDDSRYINNLDRIILDDSVRNYFSETNQKTSLSDQRLNQAILDICVCGARLGEFLGGIALTGSPTFVGQIIGPMMVWDGTQGLVWCAGLAGIYASGGDPINNTIREYQSIFSFVGKQYYIVPKFFGASESFALTISSTANTGFSFFKGFKTFNLMSALINPYFFLGIIANADSVFNLSDQWAQQIRNNSMLLKPPNPLSQDSNVMQSGHRAHVHYSFYSFSRSGGKGTSDESEKNQERQ